MKLRSTLLFAAASLSASALLPVAATTSAFFAASAVPAMAWEIDETTGLPDATLTETPTTVSAEHTVSEDTAYSFTDAGENSNVNITLINGAGALLLPSGQNSQYALGTVSGEGDVWFGGGRWRVLTTGTTPTKITSTGTLYLSGAQFWVTDAQGADGAFSTNNDVVLGLSTFSENLPALDNTALRVDADAELNGTTTIIPDGTRIGFQNDKSLTIANLAGSGDIETSAHYNSNSESTLTISDSSNYTGTIFVAPFMTLVWNDADAKTVRVANATSSHDSGFTFAENFDGKVVYSGNLDPTRLTLGENARLELSGTNNSTWSLTAGTLSADVLFKTNYTLGHGASAALTLSGNVSADEGTTLTVNKVATFSGETTSLQSFFVNSSGEATFSAGTATIAGSLTSEGTISVSGGSLTIGGNDVRVSLVSDIAVSAGAKVTVNAGTTFVLDDMTAVDGVYMLFSGEGKVAGPQSGWTFLLDDVVVGTRGTLSDDRKKLTVKNYSLTWNGGPTGTWDTTSENWSGGSTTFFPGDSVTFDTADATVTLVGDLTPAGVTINAATTFTGEGTVSVAPDDSLTISDGASLTLAGGVTLDFGTFSGTLTIEKTILSSAEDRGRVKVVSTSSDAAATKIRLGEGFNGTLVYSGKLNPNNLTVGDDAQLVLSESGGGGSIWSGSGNPGTINNDILFTSDYRVGDSSNATITLAGNVSADEGKTLTLGGTRDAASGTQVNLSGNVDADIVMQEWGTTTFTGAQNTLGDLRFGKGIVNFGSENAASGTEISSVTTVGNIVMGHTNNAGTLNVRADAALTVTGSSMSTGGSEGSFMIGNYSNQAQTVNVSGALNLQNAGITTRDGTGTVNILEGGEVNFNVGLTTASNNSEAARATVVLESGGRMNIGSGGITESTTLGLTLKGGTIGSLAESWSSSRAMTLDGNVTFDTTLMEFNASGKAMETENGSSVTLSGVLSGSGSLVKTGAGTLELNNNNAYSGGTTVKEGTLVARRDGALGTGDVVVAGGTLEISGGGTVNLVSGQRLTLESGVVSVAEETNFVVAGTLELDSAIEVAGSVSFSDSVCFVLNWDLDGDATKTFNLFSLGTGVTLDASWETLGENNVFVGNTSLRGAEVEFNTDGSVSVTLDAAAKSKKLIWKGDVSDVWFDEGNWVTEDGTSETFYSRDSAVFNSPASVELSGNGVTAGTVEINAGEGGTVSFSGGQVMAEEGFTVNSGTLHLVNTSVTAGTLAVKAGTTVSMTVTAGEVNFAANVDIAQNADGSAAGAFNATVSGGTLNFSGNADIGTVAVQGGTVNFTGTATTDLITLDNANSALTVSGNVTTKQLYGTATIAHGENTSTISAGGVLNITGTVTDGSKEPANSNAAFALTHWGSTHTFNVEGVLNVANAGISNVDGTGELNIKDGGEANFGQGLWVDSRRGTVTFNVNGGTLNVGANDAGVGINTAYTGRWTDGDYPTDFTLNLNGGTIGSLAESWSSSGALTLTGKNTIDTTLKEINAGGKATAVMESDGTTAVGSSVELSGVISGSGSLVKTGAGTLTLSGALSYKGGTAVKAGTLQLMLGGDDTTGDVSVASGATLQLSTSGDAVDFGGTEEAPVTLTFDKGGVLSVGEGTVNLTERTTLKFTGEGGSDVEASEATLTYRSGEGGGTLSFASSREFGAFVFDSQGTVSSASVGKSATLSAGELSFAKSANRAAEMSGAGTLAVGKIFVNNTRSGNKISVDTLELTQAETEISVARNGSLEISSEKIVFSEGVEDGTLVKTGAGMLTVGDAFQDDFAGSLRVDAGTVSTNLLNLSGKLTLAAGTTFDGSVDASAGSSVNLGAGARIDGDLTLTDATATLGEATVTGDLTVSGTKMTFNGTVSGIGTLTWGENNKITGLSEEFHATISSAGRGVLLDFDVGLDGDRNALTEDFDFDFDASALADSFLGRDVELVYNENDTSIEIVVTGALVWNETVTHWTVPGDDSSGYEHDQWDVVTRDGVSEESAFFENGDFVQFTTAGSTRLVGAVNGGSSFAGKGTEPLGDGIVRTAGIVFDIEDGGTFTLDSKKCYDKDGNLVDDGQSFLNPTEQDTDEGITVLKDEGITVLSGNVTIGKNVVNKLSGGLKIYGGSLTVFSADALGNGAVELGAAEASTRTTLTFDGEAANYQNEDGELVVIDREIRIGNANAQIGVTNAKAVVSLDRVVKNAAAEEGAALTKLGAGTLNIARGTADDKQLDSVAVSEGTLVFTGDDGGLLSKNVSVASDATLNVEHGGDAVAFDAMDVAGTVTVGSVQDAAREFSAGTISATGTAGEISGALQLDGAEFEIDGVAEPYKGTLFYAEDADQSLAFTGTVSAVADSDAALYKAGAGTVSFASGTTDRFELAADLVLDGGTVSFGEGVEASGKLRVTGGNTRIEVSRTSRMPVDGKSSFSNLTVDKDAGVTFALGNGMWTTDSVSDANIENIGLTLSGGIAAGDGSVAFASTGGSSTLRGTVSIEKAENAESATFGQLTVGGTGTNIVDLSVGNGVKFSADAVTLYGASSLKFVNLQKGEAEGKEEGKATATIDALEVIDNAGNAAKLDLGGGTLSLENDENVAVLYGDGTLRISNGTLNVSGQNYSAEHTPGIVLVDGATFNFDVVGDGKNDEGVVYSSLREITTEGSGGTVSKSGAGTLVLYENTTGAIAFDGTISLEGGATHLYATLDAAELTVDENATLRLFTTAKTADGEIIVSDDDGTHSVSRLAQTISGAGTIAVSGVLHANGGLQDFNGALHANGGMIVAYEALSGAATAGGNAGFDGSIRLSGGGTLAAAENVTIAKVDVDGQNSFTSFEGASLTVEKVSATAGTSLRLSGTGTLENAVFADPAEGETNGISVAGAWTLAGEATGVDSVSVAGALTLGARSAIDADAELSVSAGGTLTFEKAETYANKISLKGRTVSLDGGTVLLNGGTVVADAGADGDGTVFLTNVSAGEGSVFSAKSGTLSVSAANLGDGASALRFVAEENAVVRLDVATAWTLNDGKLSGAGTFEKAGTGTLTLNSGNHDVENIDVSAGTLSVGADAAFSGTGTLELRNTDATLESDGGQLSGFTLTGKGKANLAGETSLGAIAEATNVSLSGALSVSGNVSGSALAFKDDASLKGAETTVSRTTLSGGTITLETLTVADSSTFDESVSKLNLRGQAGTSGAVVAAFSGSLEKTGDGTWTVSKYSVGDKHELKVSAGTLVWKNAKFDKGSTITAGGTLRIEGAATETLVGTIGGTGTLELRNTDATLDIEAASGASWTLNITGTSAVTVNAALPGALRVGDAATAWLNLKENATLQGQLNIASSDATLVKAGAGTLIVETSSATTPHNIFGTLRIEEGAVSQKTAMSWMNNSVLDIGENGTFIVDLGDAAAKSNARLTGTGTLEIASTGADGYTLEGSVKEFAGTLIVADGATLNLRNGVFADGAAVTVEEGGVLAFMGREGGVIDGVSGAGTLRVDMAVTPGADSSYLTGAYVYGDNADFEGSVEVKSGILSVSAEDFATLAGRTLSVGGDGSAAALYVDDGLSAGGVARGAFLRLSGGGDLNGAFDGFESSVKKNGGVLLSGGSFSASSDFGSATAEGQLYVAEKGAQLALSGGASVGGSLFVASGAELVLGAAAASSASAAGTQTFAAEDAGTVLPDGVSGVSGDFTLNGKLTCLVTDATNLSAPLLMVAGTTTVNTAANKKAFKPEIVLDVGGFSGSLEGLTIVDSGGGIVSGAGSINQYVSVTDSAGGKWVVVKNSDGSLALSSGSQDGYGVSGNMSGVFDALYSEEEGSFFQRELSDKQGGELTRALVSLSPVSFGALIEMQSGFAALENDLLRERLEQRRYERTLASDRSTKFKPFVNILGADREGDGDGTDAANYDITHAGAIGGFDFAVSDNTIVGVSIGVDWAKADLKDGAGKHEGEGSRIGVYGMTVFENAYVGYGLSAGGMSFDTKRRYGDRTMTGDTDGNDVNATLLFGAGWTLSDAYGIDLAPYVGLDIGYVTADSFTESGSADTALDTDSIDRWSLRGKIGATLSWRATDRLRIGLDAMFAHEFGDSDIDIDAKIGGNAFSSKAYLMDENTIQIGPRIDFRIDDTWSVSAAYAFETDLDETTTHSANLGVRARF